MAFIVGAIIGTAIAFYYDERTIRILREELKATRGWFSEVIRRLEDLMKGRDGGD